MKSISTADNLSTASLDEQVSSPLKVEYIPREYISPDPEQVRKQFSQEHIERLRESFRQIGIRTPLDVVQMPDSEEGTPRYKIIDGECRYRASEGVLDKLPCIVFEDTDEASDWALSANMMRDDLNPVEKSDVIVRFMEKHKEGKKKLTLQSAAKKYHLSLSMLSEYHSLSKLDEKIKDEQRKSGQIPLRELKKLAVEKLRKDPEEMWRKYGELKKRYPTEEERVQLDGQKGPAKQKDPNAPNKIRAKHIDGMKTRPESDFEYYSRLTLDEFEKYTADELKAAKANLQAAQIRYQDLIQLLSTLQQNIEEVEQKQQAEEK